MVAPLERGRDFHGKTQAEKLVEGLDALFKQEERLEVVYDLEDLISASSNSFYFKDVSHRTLSRYNEDGSLSSKYLSMQIPGTEPVGGSPWGAWGAPSAAEESMVAAQEQNEWPNYGVGEAEANKIFDDLFPPDTQNSSSNQEAGDAVVSASFNSSEELIDHSSGTPGFPKDGMRINGANGDFVISLADFKNPSAGFNVRRQGGTSNIDEANKPLNSQPIKRFNNAFSAVRKAHGPGKLDAKFGNKNKYSVSRQERRNLLKHTDKALKSREKAVRNGAQKRARQKWVNDKKDFINDIPNNAKDAAGRGLKRLGEAAADFGQDVKSYAEIVAVPAMKEQANQLGQKILEGMDVLANYQNEFSSKVQKEWPKVRAQLERGWDAAKPHLKNIALDISNQAENLFQDAAGAWEGAKQFAREKYPIIQGLIQQAKVKGTPAWNAAAGKLNTITSKVLIGAGRAYEASRSVQNATMGFMDRMKAEFNEGRKRAMEERHGAQPTGDTYQRSKQEYWDKRADLVGDLGRANAEFGKTNDKINRGSARYEDKPKEEAGSGEKRRQADFDAAEAKLRGAVKVATEGAEAIGSSYGAVAAHLRALKDPRNTTSLPPSGKWPVEYGGERKKTQAEGNLKVAGLKKPGGEISSDPKDILDAKDKQRQQQPPPEGGEQLPLPEGAPTPQPQEGEQIPLPEPGQQMPMPGMGQVGQQPAGGGGGSGDTGDREYLKPGEQGPPGVKVQQGESRGEDGKQSRYYLRSEAKQNRANAPQNGAQAGPESGGVQGQLPLQGRLAMANDNEMAEGPPQDDYQGMIARAVEAAKQEQEESKVRMAKAGARRAVAKAGEAEAKADEAEKEAESNIAGILSKLDSGIATLTAHSDPKVSKILSKLSHDIDKLGKKKTTKK